MEMTESEFWGKSGELRAQLTGHAPYLCYGRGLDINAPHVTAIKPWIKKTRIMIVSCVYVGRLIYIFYLLFI